MTPERRAEIGRLRREEGEQAAELEHLANIAPYEDFHEADLKLADLRQQLAALESEESNDRR